MYYTTKVQRIIGFSKFSANEIKKDFFYCQIINIGRKFVS